MHSQVRRLVATGQLEFVEGGWCQADELITTVEGRAENLALGHAWLRENVAPEIIPRIGWKIDPFGASDITPYLFASAQHFQFIVQARIPAEVKQRWRSSGSSCRRWSSSSPSAPRTQILLHCLESYSGLTNQGFDFDQYRVPTVPITQSTVAGRAAVFVATAKLWHSYVNRSTANLLLLPWGGDFRWQNGTFQFGNMTKLMDYVNAHRNTDLFGGTLIRWSTVSEYLDALLQTEDTTFEHYEGDFAPYDGKIEPDDNAKSGVSGYWTGMYDSWPGLKQKARDAEAALRAAEMAIIFSAANGTVPDDNDNLELNTARSSVSIIQHHDALPGTSASTAYNGSDPIHGGFVIQDYFAKLTRGINAAQNISARALARNLGVNKVLPISNRGGTIDLVGKASVRCIAQNSGPKVWTSLLQLSLRLPQKYRGSVRVTTDTGKSMTSQLLTTSHGGVLLFVEVPALRMFGGAVSFTIQRVPGGQPGDAVKSNAIMLPSTIKNSAIAVNFDAGGSPQYVSGPDWNITLTPQLMSYKNESGGSYCFTLTPGDIAVSAVSKTPDRFIASTGPLVTLIHQEWNIPGLEIDWIVRNSESDGLAGAIRMTITNTKPTPERSDTIIRFNTNIMSDNTTIEVDTGLWNIFRPHRKLEGDEIGGNYHPAVKLARISDGRLQVALATERVTGTASLSPGQLEAKLLRDQPTDGCHLGPPARDISLLSQSFEVIAGDLVNNLSSIVLPQAVAAQQDPLAIYTTGESVGQIFTNEDSNFTPKPVHSIRLLKLWPAGNPAPPNTHHGVKVLVRLAIIGEAGAIPSTVTLAQILPDTEFSSVVETTLSGNKIISGNTVKIVTLQPGTIRTFVGVLTKKA